MFTGIIAYRGTVEKKIRKANLLEMEIDPGDGHAFFRPGDSVSVNGVCLTVARKTGRRFIAQVIPATRRATNLGALQQGDIVNLEPSLHAGDSVGGHFVLGHIDGIGKIVKIRREHEYLTLQIKAPEVIMQHLVRKGSVAVEGISLTVQDVQEESFRVAIIPYTLEHTNLKKKRAGHFVNLETDLLAKYARKYLQGSSLIPMPLSTGRRPANRRDKAKPELTEKYLRRQGF